MDAVRVAQDVSLETQFERFRRNIIGADLRFATPYGEQRLVYTDWTASGRLYAPIERRIVERFGPYVGNTHTETNLTGTAMTHAYHEAQAIIKRHVNAAPTDVIITAGSGMTALVNKFIRILGLRIPEQLAPFTRVPDHLRPVVFVTHMEHHSNQTPWLESVCDVEVIEPDDCGLVNCEYLAQLLEHHRNRPLKIGTFTACSNVTGIETPYAELARLMHAHGGHCFVDFAASAPYVRVDMHPSDPAAALDAVFFSPHKFLGGPGSSGVLVFNSELYHNRVPDQPGGGTVNWTNPWKEHRFIDNIEVREDGGTPAFLQTIKAGLAVKLKEAMGPERMRAREAAMLPRVFEALRRIPRLHLLAGHIEERLGIVSFYLEHVHYNLVVKLLNDRFGVQTRGGCSCAGTYGHYLLHVDPNRSHAITEKIDHGDFSDKPGWVRMSIHPTMTDADLDFVLNAIHEVASNGDAWGRDYTYSSRTNEYQHINGPCDAPVRSWFELPDD